MRYSAIYDCDLANGLGWRVSLFVSGCRLHCKGCFNQCAWDFNYGKEYTEKTKDKIIELLSRPYIKGLSLLGGNPTEPENEPELIELCKEIKAKLPEKDIWIWSGDTYETLLRNNDKLIKYCDVLVDGPYVESQRDASLAFRGSSNQRIIDLKKSAESHSTIVIDR